MSRRRLIGAAAILFTVGAGPVIAIEGQTAPATWPDTPLARAEALALIESLNADLLSHDSATLTLERWCGAHALAAQPKIVAQRVHGPDKLLSSELRGQMGIDLQEPVKYRHVQLMCGTHVLSEADNWYVPARLTTAMNQQLDTTDTPFGKVVLPLHFRRLTLDAKLLWSPLTDGWEMHGIAPMSAGNLLHVPAHILQHRAVLFTDSGQPFSLVVETYTDQVLAFPFLAAPPVTP